ncbi:MAG: DUF1800 domain-containing protein [Vicinamibacterales bacterium]
MRRAILAGAAVVAAAALVSARTGAATFLSDDDTVRHVLNRVAFGPSPGDVARVRQMGVEAYVDQQLRPSTIPDERVRGMLESFATLHLGSREIAERYEIPALRARLQQQRSASDRTTPSEPQARRPPQADPGQPQPNVPLLELAEQKMLRAVYADRQLEEVLTDFWFNHFNVDARKGPTRFMLTEYERDAIRPHVLGRFRDLLGATAKSPAMLFYLDNWMSTAAGATMPAANRPRRGLAGRARQGTAVPPRTPDGAGGGPRRPAGLNENYARELLELHTLGVDGGYTQEDVTEVARAFTGWTIDRPRAGGGFRFAAALHDSGEKVVLGQRLPAGTGQDDGERVLDILATHPSTARFIARKLAVRFVGDAPPTTLVDRMAAVFMRTRGDLWAVTSELLHAPEFLAPDARRAKVKTPFEFVVSSLRALEADVRDARALVRVMDQLGMPLYRCQPPTGYADAGHAWINTGALVNRMNVALGFATGAVRGVQVPAVPDPIALLGEAPSAATRATVARAESAAQAIALALGSPEFQKR